MLSNASVVEEPLTQVQRRVRLIEFMIEFGIVVVGIIAVISEGRRGGSSGATALECPVKSVSCDRYAMLCYELRNKIVKGVGSFWALAFGSLWKFLAIGPLWFLQRYLGAIACIEYLGRETEIILEK